MDFEERYATSNEMMKYVKRLKIMPTFFNKNMDKINWKLVRESIGLWQKVQISEDECVITNHTIDGIKAVAFTPYEMDNQNIIIYLHGGGFVNGGSTWGKEYLTSLANYSKMKVYSIEYSLAPEKKFPEGVNDSFKVYKKLIEWYPDSEFAFIGESAGANLVLSLYFKSKEANVKLPKALICNSGIYDLSDNIKRDKNARDYKVKEDIIPALRKLYAGDSDLKDPLLSPLYGDFENIPDTLITVDSQETLYPDSKELYKVLESKKVKGKMLVYHDTFHAFVTLGEHIKESDDVLKDTSDFIRKKLITEKNMKH